MSHELEKRKDWFYQSQAWRSFPKSSGKIFVKIEWKDTSKNSSGRRMKNEAGSRNFPLGCLATNLEIEAPERTIRLFFTLLKARHVTDMPTPLEPH
jgi:hypothetical protein